jgi:FkbM family methyltransferase
MKKLVKTLLKSRGMEIMHTRRFGADPWHDVNAIFHGVSPRTIFDVGANRGQTSLEFLVRFPHACIHSFEPFQDSFDQLKVAMGGNPRNHCVAYALGDEEGRMELHLNSQSATNSLLPNAPEAETYQPEGFINVMGTAKIQVSTVTRYCEKEEIEFIDVLKTDTQGYDLKVLKGAGRMIDEGKIAAVFCEVLFAPIYEGQAYFHDIYGHLWDRGFRLVNLYGVEPNSERFSSWCDALFIHPDVLGKRVADLTLQRV